MDYRQNFLKLKLLEKKCMKCVLLKKKKKEMVRKMRLYFISMPENAFSLLKVFTLRRMWFIESSKHC